jgi:hypothetical protein
MSKMSIHNSLELSVVYLFIDSPQRSGLGIQVSRVAG